MDSITNKILSYFNSYYLVGIYMSQDSTVYYLIQLSYYKKELRVENRYKTDNLKGLKQKLKKGFPVLLHFEGLNVINKAVENKPNYKNELVFKADLNDFYFHEQKTKETIYASVVRKEIIDNYIQELQLNNNFVIGFSIGPFVLSNLLILNLDANEFSSPFFTIKTNEEQIESFDRMSLESNTVLNIENETFNGFELPLVALFIGQKFIEKGEDEIPVLTKNKSEQKFKTYFQVFGVAFLVVIMLSLLIGHFTLNSLANNLVEKKAEYVLIQESSNKTKSLNEEIQLKEKILQYSGLSKHDFITKYITDIGNSVQGNLLLNIINIYPIDKKIRDNEKVKYDLNKIIIEGEALNDKDFSSWISSLNHIKWIKKIEIENYEQQPSNNKFKILISI